MRVNPKPNATIRHSAFEKFVIPIPPLPSPNIPVVASLRGIAASMVCLYHFTCGNTSFISNENVFKQVASVGWLGVEIFFVISGFVIPYSMAKNGYQLRNFGGFLGRRLLRFIG